MRVSRRIDPRHSMSREAIADTRKLIRARRHGALQVLLATLMSIAPAAFAQSDSEAPEILAFTLEPTMVDTRSADATIDWCATARDDLSGLRRVVVFLPETVGASPARDESSFAEGALEDTACGTLTLSRGTPKGAYDVQLFVEDQAGNAVDYVAGDAFGHSRKKTASVSNGVRLLCPIGPCKLVNRP